MAGGVGCVDVDIKTEIHSDGSGVQGWRFTTTALLAGKLKEQLKKDPFLGAHMNGMSEEVRQGDYILTLTIPFHSVAEIQDRGRDVRFENEGWLRRTYTYSETWHLPAASNLSLLSHGLGAIMPLRTGTHDTRAPRRSWASHT